MDVTSEVEKLYPNHAERALNLIKVFIATLHDGIPIEEKFAMATKKLNSLISKDPLYLNSKVEVKEIEENLFGDL